MPLEGEIVRLREERASDLHFLQALRNDLDTQAWSKALPPDYTLEMYQKRFQGREFSYDRTDGRFIIELKETEEVAGTILYSNLVSRWEATIGIMVAKPFWGKGVAQEAQEILLRFLFEELGLRVVRLWTHSGNPHAIQLAERAGFQIALRQREAIFKAGQLYDNIVMDLLRPEYYARHPELTDRLPGFQVVEQATGSE
jgi:RimJ/RimL family protein N-acetyltransferase